MCAFRTGLDWSGDAGDPRKLGSSARLVIALPQIDESHLDLLSNAISSLRDRFGLPSSYVFRHSNARPEVRQAFARMVGALPITAWVMVIEKSAADGRSSHRSPTDHPHDSIASAITCLPPERVEGQFLYIDLPVVEIAVVNQIKRVTVAQLRVTGRRNFREWNPVPDHHYGGEIVRVADMIAGALQSRPSNDNVFCTTLGNDLKAEYVLDTTKPRR